MAEQIFDFYEDYLENPMTKDEYRFIRKETHLTVYKIADQMNKSTALLYKLGNNDIIQMVVAQAILELIGEKPYVTYRKLYRKFTKK